MRMARDAAQISASSISDTGCTDFVFANTNHFKTLFGVLTLGNRRWPEI